MAFELLAFFLQSYDHLSALSERLGLRLSLRVHAMHVLASRTELASQFSVLRARVLQMPRQLLILLFEQLSGHIGESGLLGPISEILASD